MKRKIILFLIMCVSLTGWAELPSSLPDTLQFSFYLHGQTRRVKAVYKQQGDTLALEWSLPRNLNLWKGSYLMSSEALKNASKLTFRQPSDGEKIPLTDDETAFMLSRKAYDELKSKGVFIYGNTRYALVDSLPCAPDVPSLHVKDNVEGCEMWIADNREMPVIWKMVNNPVDINWTVTNAASALDMQRNLLRIAFISDAHIQDLLTNPDLIRTMDSEVHSTRLFNENIFAFKAALNDVAKRNIKLVVLPGDLTDNGQRINIKAVQTILNDYSGRYGMSFFVTTGNHDPLRPYGSEYVSGDFLDKDGSSYFRASEPTLLPADAKGVVDSSLYCCGYKEIMQAYRMFGMSPRKDYLYWATPFSKYDYAGYSYNKAVEASDLNQRLYSLDGCSQKAIDASYVVEPVKGLWLLAIDGSVYFPLKVVNGEQIYQGSQLGYNNLDKGKPFLLKWIKQVTDEARRLGKTVITFCHYPAIDFNQGATPLIAEWLGKNKFDILRAPSADFSKSLEKAGVRLHFAGHMHVNQTAAITGDDGHKMYNVQVPSTAMCVPAYKILTVEGNNLFRVQTVVLDSVPGFDSLRPRYYAEYRYNKNKGIEKWNPDIQYATDYVTFCDMHFVNLLKARVIPSDMPPIVKDSLMKMSGDELMALASGKTLSSKPEIEAYWTGEDLVTDLYRLRYSGKLAYLHIPQWRLKGYQQLFDLLKENKITATPLLDNLRKLCRLFQYYQDGLPDTDFTIDLN